MKKIFLSAVSICTIILAGCGGGKKTETTDQSLPPGMMVLDLSKWGKNVLINIPDSTVGPLTVEDMGGAVRITVGKNFQLSVKEGEGNMDMKKNEDIKKNEVYKFDKFVVDTSDAVIYSWHMEGSQPEFRMFAVIKLGNVVYEVEDVPGEVFSESACHKMLQSARSLRLKEAKKTEA